MSFARADRLAAGVSEFQWPSVVEPANLIVLGLPKGGFDGRALERVPSLRSLPQVPGGGGGEVATTSVYFVNHAELLSRGVTRITLFNTTLFGGV